MKNPVVESGRVVDIEIEPEKTQTPCLIGNPPRFAHSPLDLEEEIDKQGDAGHAESYRLVRACPNNSFDTSERNEDNTNNAEQ